MTYQPRRIIYDGPHDDCAGWTVRRIEPCHCSTWHHRRIGPLDIYRAAGRSTITVTHGEQSRVLLHVDDADLYETD